jgi:predicted hydrocarbon binding protein
MEPLELRLQEMLKQVEIDGDGHLTLMGTRSIITPVGSLLGIMEAANDILGERGSWIIMYRAGHDTAMAFARTMIEERGMDPNEVALAYSDFARMRGWGFIRLMGMRFAEGRGRLHVYDSIFADHFREVGGVSQPVCGFITGALAGVTRAVSGIKVRAREVQCAALGAEHCEMVVEPL